MLIKIVERRFAPNKFARDRFAKFRFALGYSGWGPGQLEDELKQGDWLILPANQKLIFNTPDDIMWNTACKKLGINLNDFGGTAGIS